MLDVRFQEAERCLVKIIGVGGAGGNAVNRMFEDGIKDVFFAVCNTDFQDLGRSPVPCKIQIGEKLTKGYGCGSDSETGRKAAIESTSEIDGILGDNAMVFVTAGMGGGTGTGAAPVIAKMAKQKGLLTVGIVTLPFKFELPSKIEKAMRGAKEMLDSVDALIVINNQKLGEIYGDLTVTEAFRKADEVLVSAAKGVADIVSSTGMVNVDMADVSTILRNSGVAIMSTGEASGKNRVTDALENALSSPLLKGRKITDAKKILINVYNPVHAEITMKELENLDEFLEKMKGGERGRTDEIIWGATFTDEPGDKCKVTLIATGLDLDDVCDMHLYDKKAKTRNNDWADWEDLDIEKPSYKDSARQSRGKTTGA